MRRWETLLLFILTAGVSAAGLQIQCYQCEDVRQDDCSSPEFIVNCTVNVQDMCQKEVLVMEDGIHYRKSCASSGACLISSSGYQQFCTGKARMERMEAFNQKGLELERSLAESKKKLAEVQRRVQELSVASTDESKAALSKAQAEEKQMKKDERSWQRKLDDHRQEEKKTPWNVDTLSKEGFSKSVVNVKPEVKEETEEEKEQKHKSFVEKNEKQIKHFGMLRRWDDSQKYLSDSPHLVCEETANYLVIMCIDLEVEEKHALMEQVAHQTIVMQFILELAKSLKVDPRGCFRQFFTKIKTADQQYQDAFNDELESFKGRVRGRAKIRIEKAMKEYEEEERQKRLGPGGLDPVEVYESLPSELQKCFDDKDIQMLQDAISKLDPTEAKHHMKRCIESGLWVPNSRADEEADKDPEGGDEPQYEELKKEDQ